MKKIIIVFLTAVLVAIAVGCSKGQKSKVEDGTWTIVSVNCPYVLAEKDGKTETFSYFHPFGKNHLLAYRTQACIESVRPGWIVQVELGRYTFFPPKTIAKSPAKVARVSKPTGSRAKK
jgi:hypothetical protein